MTAPLYFFVLKGDAHMFEKVKGFVKDHKNELAIVLISAVTFGTGSYILCNYYSKKRPVKNYSVNLVANRYVTDELPKPDWGKGFDIQEHWMDASSGCPMMILDTYLYYLGEFGQKLIENCSANPDIPVGIIMTYGNN